jgi:phosphoesterase RecJ-like protein
MNELELAVDVLREAKSVSLACHVSPDGDALGSMLGLGLAARAAGKEVTASFGTPFIVPPSLGFLPVDLLIPPADFPPAPEVMVILDAGSLDRLGELGANAQAAGKTIVLDHHVTNSGFGDVAVVVPTAAATGELVFDLLQKLQWELTPEVAQCLHTALVTDTGRFQYSSTTARTLEIAARLVAAGAKPSVIGQHVYEEAPFAYLKVSAIALERARLDEELRTVVTTLTDDDLSELGISWTDTENLIDLIRLAQEADTAILAKGHRDGRVKISLRSRGATDVGALAASMGGGGHRLASGFTVEGEVDEVVERVLKVVEDFR